MYGRHFLGAMARYRCQWRCAHCGRLNRERGEVRAWDRVAPSQFTDNLYDETSLSGEIAQGKARGKLFRLQGAVNGRQWLRGLKVSGVCRKCGRRQFWAPALRHTWTAALSAFCFAALVRTLGLPGSLGAWLTFIAAAAVAALLTEGAILCVTRWRLARLTDPECAPRIDELFPQD